MPKNKFLTVTKIQRSGSLKNVLSTGRLQHYFGKAADEQYEIEQLESDMMKTISHMHNLVEEEKENGIEIKEQEIFKLKNQFFEELHKLEVKLNQTIQDKDLYETTNIQLRNKISEQNSVIALFRSQLTNYQNEYAVLLSEKEDALKEVELKYAELVGNQNQKQKIKYVVDLKMKHLKLTSENKQLKRTLKIQNRLIKKLKSNKISEEYKPILGTF